MLHHIGLEFGQRGGGLALGLGGGGLEARAGGAFGREHAVRAIAPGLGSAEGGLGDPSRACLGHRGGDLRAVPHRGAGQRGDGEHGAERGGADHDATRRRRRR